MTDLPRAPRTTEEAISLIAAGVGVIVNGAVVTTAQNERIDALVGALKSRKQK